MKLFEPFLGRLTVEALPDDTEEYLKEMYGVSKNSLLALPEDVLSDRCPLSKGKIIKISQHSFGERFEKWYGKDIAEEGRSLKLGDTVYFIPNNTYSVDPKKKYHVISDEHIIGYIKVEEKV